MTSRQPHRRQHMAHNRTFSFDIQKALVRRRDRRKTGSPKFDKRFDFKSERPVSESFTPDSSQMASPELRNEFNKIMQQVKIREDLKPNVITNKTKRKEQLFGIINKKRGNIFDAIAAQNKIKQFDEGFASKAANQSNIKTSSFFETLRRVFNF